MLRRLLVGLALLPSNILLGAVNVLALLFAPFRLGRMLRMVSVPRMREHRLRTSFTILGVALGVAVLVSVVLVGRSIVEGVTGTVDNLAGKADLEVAAGSSGFDESVLDDVRQVPGVYKLTPVLQQTASLRTKNGGRERLLILGIDLLGNEDSHFRGYGSQELDEIRREPLSFLNSSSNILIGRQIAERLGIKLHDTISINTQDGVQPFEVWGFVDANSLGNAFGGAVAVMYYPAMQVAFGRGRNIDRIDIATADGRASEEMVGVLRKRLGEGFRVEAPQSRGDRVAQMLLAVRTALLMSSALALLAGSFLVINTMGISVVQRKRELGVLRALGATSRQIVRLLTLEGALLGVVGSSLGIGLAFVISKTALTLSSNVVNEMYVEHAASEVQFDLTIMLAGFALGIVSATVAALIASNRASTIKPTDALSSSKLPVLGQAGTLRGDLFGGVMVLASLALLQIPPMGNMPYAAIAATLTITLAARALMPRLVQLVHWLIDRGRDRMSSAATILAADNLPRDLSRTASTASGLTAGVSLSIAVGTFIISFVTSLNTWSGQLLPGDLIIASGSRTVALSGRNTPMNDSMRPLLAAVPGVERVRSMTFGDIDFRGQSVKIGAPDTPRLSAYRPLEGTVEDVYAGFERGDVVLSEALSRRFDVHRGDKVELSTKDGTREFNVAAVIIDYTSDRGAVLVHRNTYRAAWGDDHVDSFELFLKPGTDRDQVRRTINETLAEKHDLFVLTTAEFRGEFVTATNKIFSLLHVLEVVTLAVAMLGMITAVLANVLDRVRELGVMRALGMLRSQLGRMVVIESTLIGAVGAAGGVVLGLVLGFVLLRYVLGVQIGWYLPYEFPAESILTMIAITLPISALAGFYPARQASRLVVSEALDYE